MIDKEKIIAALKDVYDPELKKNLIDLGMIKDIVAEDGKISLTLALTTMKCPMKNQMVKRIKDVLEALPGVASVNIGLTTLKKEELKKLFPKHPLLGIERVAHTLAVASGKGGVGKTTVSINTALALAK